MKKTAKSNSKKGESEKTSASREAASRTASGGNPPRQSTIRWLSVEQAVRNVAGTGGSAKQRRRLGL